jgi:3',5'-cyclic AMP phosphodiesterase CpdA
MEGRSHAYSGRLLAVSDLHLAAPANLEALLDLPCFPHDTLLLAGDVCEELAVFETGIGALAARFRDVVWAPGNHDLWQVGASSSGHLLDRYDQLVRICRRYGVVTPEDPYRVWVDGSRAVYLVPLFLLYDGGYARPGDTLRGREIADGQFFRLEADQSVEEICRWRVELTRARLRKLPTGSPKVFVNHYPMTLTTARLPGLSHLARWSGTPLTETWMEEFSPVAVVSGHLHAPSRRVHKGIRFENVALGYPREWAHQRGLASYLRDVTPEDRPAC